MFFDEDLNDGYIEMENHDIFHLINREIFAMEARFASQTEAFFNTITTHTEDGIPIRKIYVSNLPPKATRTDVFGLFAQYGFIKSCWLRIDEKGPNRYRTATYAFVTYSDPFDAYKALVAPSHEKILGGRSLRVSPADSWHQPSQEVDGRMRWNPHSLREDASYQQGTAAVNGDAEPQPSCSKAEIPADPEMASDAEKPYTILDILNQDCLSHVLSYVPILDLIRTECVSKRWQDMVQDYIADIRIFKTSWWHHGTLTTAVLRRVLARIGESLTRLHIDHHWTALNDRTAHTVGKFCPNLEELMVVGMHTKNWKPLVYGCKKLKNFIFISCNKLTDSSLVDIMRNESVMERITVSNNSHVTGIFLTSFKAPRLNTLEFHNCYRLQGTVLCSVIDSLTHLTTLRLDACPLSMWKIIPAIINKLPRLRELSLTEYMSADCPAHHNNDFKECFANLPELRVLNLFKNIFVTNAVLKQVAQSCPNLQVLNISGCNSRKKCLGVGDDGVLAVSNACRALSHLDVSYLAAVTDLGLSALPRLPRLRTLVSRGNLDLSAAPVAAALDQCSELQEIDLCGCCCVSEEVAEAAWRAIQVHPRPVVLRLAGTATSIGDLPSYHKLLIINVDDDLSDPNLKPDFNASFDDSSEDSFDDLYDVENFDEFFGGDNIYFPQSDDDFMDEDDFNDDLDGFYAYGLPAQDVIFL